MGKSYSNPLPLPPSSYLLSSKIDKVWIGLRHLVRFLPCPNHWSIIIEVNSLYLTVQIDVDGSIGKSYNENLRNAALATWGNQKSDVRLSECYLGNGKVTLEEFLQKISGKFTYILGFYDCQNFSREMVKLLTGKVVGYSPVEAEKILLKNNELS